MYLQEPSTPLHSTKGSRKTKRSRATTDLVAEFAAFEDHFGIEKTEEITITASLGPNHKPDLLTEVSSTAEERIEAWLTANKILVEATEVKKHEYFTNKKMEVQRTIATISCFSISASPDWNCSHLVEISTRTTLNRRLNLGLEIHSQINGVSSKTSTIQKKFLATISPLLSNALDFNDLSLRRRKAHFDSKTKY